MPSVHRLRRLHDTVRTFLERVRVEADTVHVGAIQLRGDAEVEMRFPAGADPRACLDELRDVVDLARETVSLSREVVAATQDAIRSLGDPSGHGAERCRRLEAMSRDVEQAVQAGPPLHPRQLATVHRLVWTQFRDVEGAVEVPVTTTYRY